MMIDNWTQSPEARKWIPILNRTEVKFNVPKNLLARQCYQESRFNPAARNSSGAVGIMQLLPEYFPGAGRDPFRDIETAAKYLRSLWKRFSGDWQLGLAAYDWGPSALTKCLKAGGSLESLPKETQDYVKQIIHDVPVKGSLCKTLNPQPVGFQTAPLLLGQPLEESSGNSLWHSVTGFFTRRSGQSFQVLPQHSVLQSELISSRTKVHQTKEIIMATSVGQAILAVLESDLATVGGQPLITLLTNLENDKGNVIAQQADIMAFVAAAPKMGISIELLVEQQIFNAAIAKIQSALAAKAAAPTP